MNTDNKKFSGSGICILLFLYFTVMNSPLSGQQMVTLDEAIGIALKYNPGYKASAMMNDAAQKRIRTAGFSESTAFTVELGQINSAFFDNAIGIEQGFSLPAVYSSRKKLMQANARLSDINLKISGYTLRQQVELYFLNYQWYQARKKLMLEQEGIYAEMLRKAEARFAQGESDRLELTGIRQKQMNLQSKLRLLEKELEWTLAEFNVLLNGGSTYIPVEDTFKADRSSLITAFGDVSNSNIVAAAEHEKSLAESSYNLSKTSVLPSFTIGYKNISFRGVGADEKLYNASDRFHNAWVGINFPVFQKAYKAETEARKSELQAKEAEYQKVFDQQQVTARRTFDIYREQLMQLEEFEISQLANAEAIRDLAEKRFANGSINYIEWSVLMDEVFAIRSEYLDRIYNLNLSAIQLRFIHQKNN
jgi:cobalt-zinc-cadmium resistance protein CzcA